MYVLGLTGSIGMGKTTTAGIFRKLGVPVHDSDAAVHALYEGEAVAAVEAEFPGVTREGRIDRSLLGARVRDDPAAMARLEALVHPMVRRKREAFLREAAAAGQKVAVLDVPLLFETGADKEIDAAVVVSAPEAVQKARVIGRPGMTAQWLQVIMERQMPDAEKRRRAQFIIDTGRGLVEAENQVRGVLRAVAAAAAGAGRN
ncbi:dephospho-CoA kinase [Methylocella silvestris]|uniref:Dephospho-CoA kinase n=1 Tax=Methylocella silvestris TaxID=199596 RepID=A0A2J7TF55_METSI|nr:dephospho-CoA kinase [Methylocella silvestris]PNG25396.1 dephospho-CoA kinase [Methylocella silvestris]